MKALVFLKIFRPPGVPGDRLERTKASRHHLAELPRATQGMPRHQMGLLARHYAQEQALERAEAVAPRLLQQEEISERCVKELS